uniref:Polysaccharide export outer membrane protein n=1 Tax=Candidatus Kentrum sp. DK TaxID=2126562 RepID=A0A450SAP9_9GAMM|nr:MAG: polysaccharide export outer membrane protein [Candidatus Kentron sp. DK]
MALVAALLSGCVSSSGPSRGHVLEVGKQTDSGIYLLEIDNAVARRVFESGRQPFFSETFGNVEPLNDVVGPGDVLVVSIWEAPPATLFGAAVVDPRMGVNSARASVLPEQMVALDGAINVPFAGQVPVTGKSPQQIEREIVRRLTGKANQPQVMVRVAKNVTSNVTVVGEVAQSLRMPLTAKGERLLDAIAAAGGVTQPVRQVMVQIARGAVVQSMPLTKVIESPKENVPLAPGDIVTVHFRPFSFTVLGATGKNEEIDFEARGISLAQALARAGGIQDARADPRGVFVFRFENPRALAAESRTEPATPEGRIPVVYRLNVKDPRSFLAAQRFPIRDKDVMYVANASSAEMQKFLNILTSSIFSVDKLLDLSR